MDQGVVQAAGRQNETDKTPSIVADWPLKDTVSSYNNEAATFSFVEERVIRFAIAFGFSLGAGGGAGGIESRLAPDAC